MTCLILRLSSPRCTQECFRCQCFGQWVTTVFQIQETAFMKYMYVLRNLSQLTACRTEKLYIFICIFCENHKKSQGVTFCVIWDTSVNVNRAIFLAFFVCYTRYLHTYIHTYLNTLTYTYTFSYTHHKLRHTLIYTSDTCHSSSGYKNRKRFYGMSASHKKISMHMQSSITVRTRFGSFKIVSIVFTFHQNNASKHNRSQFKFK